MSNVNSNDSSNDIDISAGRWALVSGLAHHFMHGKRKSSCGKVIADGSAMQILWSYSGRNNDACVEVGGQTMSLARYLKRPRGDNTSSMCAQCQGAVEDFWCGTPAGSR